MRAWEATRCGAATGRSDSLPRLPAIVAHRKLAAGALPARLTWLPICNPSCSPQAAALYLAARGADVEAEDAEGETPLGAAHVHGKLRDSLAAVAKGELTMEDLMLE